MSSLNATTSSGIIATADNTATLQLQTAGVNALNIDASQRAAFVAGTAAAPAITTAGDTNTGIFFPAADTTAFAEGGVEAMRIDANGNVLVGTTTSGFSASGRGVIEVNGSSSAYVALKTGDVARGSFNFISSAVNIQANSAPITFGTTGGTEWMRMTSGGSLCLGVTTPNSSFNNSAARLTSGQWGIGPTVDFGNFYLTNASGVGVQLISGNTSWSTLSDERLKTDLKPIENAVEKVSTLRTVTGRYIKDEDTVSRAFLIAQDVQAVLPEAVNAGEDEEQTLQLKYTDTIPLLVAAIKELKEIVDSQAERIKALEAK